MLQMRLTVGQKTKSFGVPALLQGINQAHQDQEGTQLDKRLLDEIFLPNLEIAA